jgi:hypothetical protein
MKEREYPLDREVGIEAPEGGDNIQELFDRV